MVVYTYNLSNKNNILFGVHTDTAEQFLEKINEGNGQETAQLEIPTPKSEMEKN